MSLSFERLRSVNVERSFVAFNMRLDDWSPLEWAGAMAGEAGEASNLCKKMRRGEKVPTEALAEELADVIIYADLLAARQGINLGKAVRDKFNKVSRQRGCEIRL